MGPIKVTDASRRIVLYDSARCGNIPGDRAGVSKSHSRHGKPPLLAVWWVETSPVNTKAGRSHPAEGPNPKYGE
jgi:hypothetical protein